MTSLILCAMCAMGTTGIVMVYRYLKNKGPSADRDLSLDLNRLACRSEISEDVAVGVIHQEERIIQVLEYGGDTFKLLSGELNETEVIYKFENNYILSIYYGFSNMSYSLSLNGDILSSGSLLPLNRQRGNLGGELDWIRSLYIERNLDEL